VLVRFLVMPVVGHPLHASHRRGRSGRIVLTAMGIACGTPSPQNGHLEEYQCGKGAQTAPEAFAKAEAIAVHPIKNTQIAGRMLAGAGW